VLTITLFLHLTGYRRSEDLASNESDPELFTHLIFQSLFPIELSFIRHLNDPTAFRARGVSAFLSRVWGGLTCASLTPRSGSCRLGRVSSSRQCHIVGRGNKSDRIVFYHKTCRPHDIQVVTGVVEVQQMDFLDRTRMIVSAVNFRCLLKLWLSQHSPRENFCIALLQGLPAKNGSASLFCSQLMDKCVDWERGHTPTSSEQWKIDTRRDGKTMSYVEWGMI